MRKNNCQKIHYRNFRNAYCKIIHFIYRTHQIVHVDNFHHCHTKQCQNNSKGKNCQVCSDNPRTVFPTGSSKEENAEVFYLSYGCNRNRTDNPCHYNDRRGYNNRQHTSIDIINIFFALFRDGCKDFFTVLYSDFTEFS